MKRTICLILCCALLLGTLSGCTAASTDYLYQLPKLPAAYDQLQAALQTVLDQGAEFSNPISGLSRQPVQMADLDGDGVQEAVAIFRVEEEQPLRIYVFKEMDGAYRTVGLIQEEGESVEMLSFVDLDGSGKQAIILGLQAAEGTLKIFSVYSLGSGEPVCLLKSGYTEYACYDLDADGKQEVLLANYDATSQVGTVSCYHYKKGGMEITSSVTLSSPITDISRITVGSLLNEVPALFVTSSVETGGTVTDILACQYGQMVSLTPAPSGETLGGIPMEDGLLRETDLNEDGIMEVPRYRSLLSTDDENYRVIDWYSYDLEGEAHLVETTYHNIPIGWYFVIPERWDDGNLGIRRVTSASGSVSTGITFFYRDGNEEIDLLTVYLLSGTGRNKAALVSGRFIIYELAESILAGELANDVPDSLAITHDEVLERAKLIKTDWLTGSVG